jgi:hypothetical protein
MTRLNQSRRQLVGQVYSPQVNNNIGTVQSERNMALVQAQAFDYNMEGDGFGDIVRGIFNKGKQGLNYIWRNKETIAKKAEDAYTGETGTALRNLLPDSDDTARPGFTGEKHAILQLKNGKNGVANWMGPGTNVIARLKRGDPGRTPSDMVAKKHDIGYALAAGEPTREKQLAKVREADNRMIRSLQGIQSGEHGGDASRNIQMGMRLIQAKTLGEDLGVLDKAKFAGSLNKISDPDKILLMSNNARLTQEGYGMLPGDRLKQKLLKKMVREKKMGKLGRGYADPSGSGHVKSYGTSYSKTLPGMKAYPLKGMGGKGDIMSFLMKGVVPNLMKSVGISPSAIPLTKIAPMVSKALELAKSGDLASIISNLTKTLLPILTHGKMKTIGVKMSGQGIMDVVHSSGLDKKLASGLFNAFKYHRNRMAVAQGKRPPYPKGHSGSGLNLPGGSWGSFWKGFKKGFVSVFKPGAQILGTVASALGQPEFGIPLTAIAGAI